MIGIVIITHGGLAETLIETSKMITSNPHDAITPISITVDEDHERLKTRIGNAIKSVNRKKGILVLTDMFGGSPSNIAYSFLEEGQVEVISGINLPMLVQAVDFRERMSLDALAEKIVKSGRAGIMVGSKGLKGEAQN